MKLVIATILIVAGSSISATQGYAPSQGLSDNPVHRQARYMKGDIPLLLIRPKHVDKKPGVIRLSMGSSSTPLGTVKSEDPSGSYSETSYIYKTNDESLSFTELLPKLGLSTSLFGLPSVASRTSHPSHLSTSPSHTPHSSNGGPHYKPAPQSEPSFQPSTFSDYNSANHATYQQHPQKVTVKSQLHTSISGDPTFVSGKNTHSSTGSKPSFSSSFKKLPNHHFTYLPQSHHQQQQQQHTFAAKAPAGVVEEIVVGKPIGNIRPSLSHSELAHPADHHHENNLPPYEHQHQEAPHAPEIPDAIHSSQSDQKFGHITTNYYIPHTVHSESEYKKPFAPSPQVEYFVPQESGHDGHQSGQLHNHYFPSEEANHQLKEQHHVEYQTESSPTEEYFLPKLHPTYQAPNKISPSPAVAQGHSDSVVYQENPSFSSFFKFGTKLEDSNKVDPRPHTFPKTESSISYGSLFKPKASSTFSARPSPAAEERPTAAKAYYTIKQEPIDYNPYKSAPFALLKPQYANQEQDLASKFQAIIQKPANNVFQREFSTKQEAESFVKNQIYSVAGPQEVTVEKLPIKWKTFDTPSTAAPTPVQEAHTAPNYPEGFYGSKKTKFSYHHLAENEIKPVVEPASAEGHYHPLPDTPAFDNAHLDLGLAGSEPTNSVVRPSIQLKHDIESKKSSSTDPASATSHTSPSHETNQSEGNSPSADDNTNNNGDSNPPKTRPGHQQRRKNPNKQQQTKGQSVDISEKNQENQPERKRRISPRQKLISCERQCIQKSTSQEYDPVCGTDGKTYSNKGKLRCTQKCGKEDLDVDHVGSCSPTH